MSYPNKFFSIPNPIHLVFIDSAIQDIQNLIEGVVADAQVVVLHPEVDGVMQITQTLQNQPQIGTIHLVAHGSPGCLCLGNAQLSLKTLESYAPELRTWREAMSQQGQMLLYGCHLAAGEMGAEFVQKLHQLTGVKIAASTTAIGNAADGGNWELDVRLERAASEVKTELPLAFRTEAMAAYAGVLNTTPSSSTESFPFDFNRNQWRILTISDLLAGITDPDNDSLTISNLTASAGTILNRIDGNYSYIPPVDFLGEITFTYDVSDGQNPPSQQTRTVQVVETSFIAVYDNAPEFNQLFGVSDLIKVYWDYDANGNVIASAKDLSRLASQNPNILINDVRSAPEIFNAFEPSRSLMAIRVFQASNNPPSGDYTQDGLGNLYAASYFFGQTSNTGGTDTATNIFTRLYMDMDGPAVGLINLSNPELKFALKQGKPITESYAYGVITPASIPGLPRIPIDGGSVPYISFYYNYVTLSLERNAPPVATPKSLSFQEDAGDFSPELQSTIQGGTGLLDGVQDESTDPNWLFYYGLVRIDGIPGVQALAQTNLYYDGDPSDIVVADTGNAAYQHLAQGATQTIVGSFTVQDDFYKTATAPLTVTFTGVNDAPVAVADTASGLTNTIIEGSVATNDSDVDDGAILTYSLSASVDGLTLNADGSYSLDTTHPAYSSLPLGQTLPVVANYRVTDEFGTSSDSTLTLTLTGASAPNRPPTGSPTVTLPNTAEDNAITINTADLLAGFSDVDGDTLSVVNLTATNGSLVNNNNGTYTFTPTANFNGVVNLTYGVSDSKATLAGQTRSFTVTPVNDAPTGSPTVTLNSTQEDTAINITAADLLAGFGDVDGDTLSVVNLTATNGALVNNNGTYTFTPTANFNGNVTLTYGVSDGTATLAGQTRSFNVTPVNDAPTGSPTVTLNSTQEDTAINITASSLLAGFSDVDGDTLSVVNLTATNGALANNNNGTYTFTPTVNFNGNVTLTYGVSDGTVTLPGQTRSFNVTPVNNAPKLQTPIDSAVVDIGQVLSNGIFSFSNSGSDANFKDPDTSDTLRYSFTSAPNWLTVTSAGVIGGTVPTTASGTYTATLTATDPSNATASSTFSLIVANNSGGNGDDVVILASTALNGGGNFNAKGGNDLVYGRNNAADQIGGAEGNDILYGYDPRAGQGWTTSTADGDDKLLGAAGNDKLYGGNGDDELFGGDGNDLLLGMNGNDRLIAGDGNDTVVGGVGNDILNGGYGDDIFVLKAGEGSDTIQEFSKLLGNMDKIGLAGGLTFSNLTFSGNQIKYGSEVLATLTGFNTASLLATDFVAYTGSTTSPV